jgi:ParB family chromosome partitioning protein
MSKRKPIIEMVPVEQINILNPRTRNKKIFMDITENITRVGLKRPITVTRRKNGDGKKYDLVCGQGRLEAFIACGQKQIPAVVIEANQEEALIMSLVENLARRQYRTAHILQGIEILREKGYDAKTIASKTGNRKDYIYAVLSLLKKGEKRLLAAVESGNIPMSMAVKIAESPEDEQRILQEAYESNQLRGSKLIAVKKLLDARRRHGTGVQAPRYGPKNKKTDSDDVMKIYLREANRQQSLKNKAAKAEEDLTFIKEAFRQLFAEDNFKTVLKAEGLITMPKQLQLLIGETE